MKFFATLLVLYSSCSLYAQERSPKELAELIPLNEAKVKNARIHTAEPTQGVFETTLFAIGRIQTIPTKHTVVSSRISGRVVSRPPIVGNTIKKGDVVLKVESRQPGSPPPIISIFAPADGMVSHSHVKLGEPVDPSKELMDIVDISEVWAVANIPESKASEVKIGQTAHLRVLSLGNETFKGKLIRFGSEANPDTGTVQAIFLLKNPEYRLKPNMLTEFNIVVKTREDVFSIPKSAVQGDQLTPHVFTADHELKYTYKKVPVVLGEESNGLVEVILQNKEDPELNVFSQIVTNGGYFLSHSNPDKQSLKEALDAAHGHEHNEDGSEMTAAQNAQKEQNKKAGEGGGVSSEYFILLIASNAITLGLLIFTVIRKKDVN